MGLLRTYIEDEQHEWRAARVDEPLVRLVLEHHGRHRAKVLAILELVQPRLHVGRDGGGENRPGPERARTEFHAPLEPADHLTVGKKVRVLLTASDVIHAWWVPALGMKKDAIPGFVNELWFRAEETGVYRGQCAELCGRDHGFMPVVVDVKTQADYDAWIKAQQGEKPAVAQATDSSPALANQAATTVAKAE